jgi:hypothetical protein
MILTILTGACAGPPPASEPASQAPTASAMPTTLLPDGIWQVELYAADLAGAEPGVFSAGQYRFEFDGTRARIRLADGSTCDADAAGSTAGIQLAWHCGGSDTIRWRVGADGLYLNLVTSGSGNPKGTKAVLEAKPWNRVPGAAHLDWSTAWVTCSHPDGGACRNALTAGTYATGEFLPGLHYSVPDGWQNLSDLQGEVFLLAPGYSPEDVNSDQSESISVFTSVRAENRLCATATQAESDEPGVAHTPEAMAAEFQARPGLVTSTPQPVSIGGLTGLVMDIGMAAGWTGTCFYSPEPVVQLIAGAPPSEFEHPIIEGLTMRVYLLDLDYELRRLESTLAIEVDDVSGGAHLDGYSKIVETFSFG